MTVSDTDTGKKVATTDQKTLDPAATTKSDDATNTKKDAPKTVNTTEKADSTKAAITDKATDNSTTSTKSTTPLPPAKVIEFSSFDALFPTSATNNLQIAASTYYKATHPFAGKPIDSEYSVFFEDIENTLLEWEYYATHKFTIDKNYDGYIIRDGDQIEQELNCINLYIYDKNSQKFVQKQNLSCISTSGMLYQNSQTWITDINLDQFPDIVQRVLVWHYSGLNNEVIIGKIWQGTHFADYDLSQRQAELKEKFKFSE